MPRKQWIAPITQRDAFAFTREHHHHLAPPRGSLFQAGLMQAGDRVGVAIATRPVARLLDDGFTMEIARLCLTDAGHNAVSQLVGALGRAGAALGFRRLITYTRSDETGASMRAAGLTYVGVTRAEGWGRPSRARKSSEQIARVRWERWL